MSRAVVMGSLEQSLATWAFSAGGTLALAPHNIHVAQGGKEEVIFFLPNPMFCENCALNMLETLL